MNFACFTKSTWEIDDLKIDRTPQKFPVFNSQFPGGIAIKNRWINLKLIALIWGNALNLPLKTQFRWLIKLINQLTNELDAGRHLAGKNAANPAESFHLMDSIWKVVEKLKHQHKQQQQQQQKS